MVEVTLLEPELILVMHSNEGSAQEVMVANSLMMWMEEAVVVEIVGVAVAEEDIQVQDDPTKVFVMHSRKVNATVATHADFLMKEEAVAEEMLMQTSRVVVVVAMLDLAMHSNVANATVATAADSLMM
mmetsp:Transcript_27963/g.38515  ORF Transcript_27963/g.38515 Transcript_27963/m.38515 type:complete len:128 (+) Transcript_27963:206-589(+)